MTSMYDKLIPVPDFQPRLTTVRVTRKPVPPVEAYEAWLQDNFGPQVKALEAQGVFVNFRPEFFESRAQGEHRPSALTIRTDNAGFCFKTSAMGKTPDECRAMVRGALERMPAMQEAFAQYDKLYEGTSKHQRGAFPVHTEHGGYLVDADDWQLVSYGTQERPFQEHPSRWMDANRTKTNVEALVTQWCQAQAPLEALKDKQKAVALLKDPKAFESVARTRLGQVYVLDVPSHDGRKWAMCLSGEVNDEGTPHLRAQVTLLEGREVRPLYDESKLNITKDGIVAMVGGPAAMEHTFTAQELDQDEALMAFYINSNVPMRETFFTKVQEEEVVSYDLPDASVGVEHDYGYER